MTRREILKILSILPGVTLLQKLPAMAARPAKPDAKTPLSTIYRSVNGTPEENLDKAICLFGGLGSIIGAHDVVVIKPNVQWWNQGAPNIDVLYRLVHMIMNLPGGFFGEVVIAENCHRGDTPWEHAGWSNRFERNVTLAGIHNYNDLGQKLKQEYGDRYSTVHWINVKNGAKRVFSPEDGPGYVYCDGTGGIPSVSLGNGASGESYRETIMTYPIFRTDRGTVVDYKNGIWENGAYSAHRLKVINLAALNHHSNYCGFTSAVKNYLGVSDLSGGPDPLNEGMLTDQYYNFHSFPFNKWAPGPELGMLGAEIGVFFTTIRKADLHIVTAEWIGLSDRLEPPVAKTRIVLASTDPVALDFHSGKYILFPNSGIRFHNPESQSSPACQYLKACSDHGGGVFDETKVELISFDHKSGQIQGNQDAVVIGQKKWGSSLKGIVKYLLMRYFAFLL